MNGKKYVLNQIIAKHAESDQVLNKNKTVTQANLCCCITDTTLLKSELFLSLPPTNLPEH
jgi:hypothetical protein